MFIWFCCFSFPFLCTLSHLLLISTLLICFLFQQQCHPKRQLSSLLRQRCQHHKRIHPVLHTRKSRVRGKHITPQKRAAEFPDDMVVRQIKDEDQMWCKHCGQHVNHLEKTFSFFCSHAMVCQAMGPPAQCVATYAYLLSNQDNFGVLHVASRPFVVQKKTMNNDEQRRTTF